MIRPLTKLLSVETLPRRATPPPVESDAFVVSTFLKRPPGMKRRAVAGWLKGELGDRVAERKPDWGFAEARLMREVSAGGRLSLPMRVTRTYGYVKLLCGVEGRERPKPWRPLKDALFDACAELHFAREPSKEKLDALVADWTDWVGSRERVMLLPSRHQYTVYDDGRPKNEFRSCKMTFLINPAPDKSVAEVQKYWRTEHAALALRNLRYLKLTRYRQLPTPVDDSPAGLDTKFGGVASAERTSLASIMWDLFKVNTFRFNNTVVLDELNFSQNTPLMLLKTVREI